MVENILWSCVGSAGTVGVADLGKVVLYNSVVQLGIGLAGAAGAEAASVAARASFVPQGVLTDAVIRYGLTSTVAFELGHALELRLRYRDGDGHLIARFIQVEITTGAEQTLLLFDSRAFPPPSINFKMKTQGASISPLNFNDHAYYIELTLSAFESPIRPLSYPPGVSIIQLVSVPP